MYIPKSWHWVFPVSVVLIGFTVHQGVRYYYGVPYSWEVYLLVQYPLAHIAIQWGAYIWQAGVAYQNYLTGAPSVDERQQERDRQAAALAWAMDNPHTVTGGNIPVVVPVVETVQQKHKLHPVMEEYQFVSSAPVLDEWRVRIGMKRLCKRQFVFRNHLGKPEGDYREETWVKSGEFTRRALKVSLGILAHAGGIARKGIARNASYVTTDWKVIELGAQGAPLPHPKGCECDSCAAK